MASGVMLVDEIEPGMKGYGLTVFYRTNPENFNVKSLMYCTASGPDQDMILIRTPHPV